MPPFIKHLKEAILLLIVIVSLVACDRNEAQNDIFHNFDVEKGNDGALQDGDIIFQSSLSGQGKAIRQATGSVYTHCGIVFEDKGRLYVFEAVQPVKSTPLDNWIARGRKGHYVAKRLKNADEVLTDEVRQSMKAEGRKFKGKNYDLTFGWNDDKLYCSELVWKLYERAADVELCELSRMGDFDLSHPEVQRILKVRYGDKIPLDEKVVSPAAIFESDLLQTVKSEGSL
jgi:hypothetical protein